MKFGMTVFLMILFVVYPLSAKGNAPLDGFKYIDGDRDNRNDIFRDANGDGVNDVDGIKYKHKFPFIDKDRDGLNDVFRDADGDGINDIDSKNIEPGIRQYYKYIDSEGEVIQGNNTIKATKPVLEKSTFIDEDGDGINDEVQSKEIKKNMKKRGKQDVFIDKDGDGINDGRSFSRERRRGGGFGDGSGGDGSGGGAGGKQYRGGE
jgi:hypothetical protein